MPLPSLRISLKHNAAYIFLTLGIILTSMACMKMKNSSNNLLITGVQLSLPICKITNLQVHNKESIKCQGIEFFISQSKHEQEPLTIDEEFLYSFKGNYYHNFFKKIHIDSKLFNVFKDSVGLISVSDIDINKKQLFHCKSCNKSAILIFRSKIYSYPFFWPESKEDKYTYSIKLDTFTDYRRKIWISNYDSLPSGLSIKIKENTPFTMYTPTSLNKDKIRTILTNSDIIYNH